ncbi:hypothetical protein [Hymenobacter perfusus]|uniref:Uncharacterized protein n=1 Tax=Hymenobacter perfusus TaxID=1236770 RepID=A0A428K1A7_9BACT|nr:hypothetical protein [Hymenobacter perfusus]RSK40175.1 hypothetical protein EI293_19595 [Hymenobacter perfusus]
MLNTHPDEVEEIIEKFNTTINNTNNHSSNKIEKFMDKLEDHRLTYDNDDFLDNSAFNKGADNLESSDSFIEYMFNSLNN